MNQRDYFEALYANTNDPWHYKTRWYEQRKRDISLAVLPKPHYPTAIELGCSNGVFSQSLANRCGQLLAIDGNAQAISLATQQLSQVANVNVQQAVIPEQLPSQHFDLIVISEILYYLNRQAVEQVLQWVNRSLNSQGTLLCVHWRYPIARFELNGEIVHSLITNHIKQFTQPFYHQMACQDADFLLDVWQVSTTSVAQHEGLVE